MQTQRNRAPRYMYQSKTQNPYSLSVTERLAVMEALDHIQVVRQYQEMGCCSVCKKISIKKCSACATFYCSNECQTFDWPKHREKCSKHRDGHSESNSFSSSRQMRVSHSLGNFSEGDKTIPMITNRGSPFTALANQLSKKPGSVINENKNCSSLKIGNGRYRSSGYSSEDPSNVSNENSKERNKKPPKPYSTKASTPGNKMTALPNCTTAPLQDIEYSPAQDSETLKRTNTGGSYKVVGTYRQAPNRYWVMALSDLEKYEKIQSTLSKECESYESIEPKVGQVCACTYGDDWFRARILSLTPEISVHFMDFGNTSAYSQKLFKKLPFRLRTPGLAFLIEFDEDTPNQYKTKDLDTEKFTIEETGSTSDGAICVKVIDGPYGSSTAKVQVDDEMNRNEQTSSTKRSAVDALTATSTGMLFFLPGEGTTRFASIVPDKYKDASECIEKVLSIDIPKTAPLQAAEGEYVLVTDKDENDQRGKVISKLKSSYKVQLVDCGNVIATDTVYPLPEHLKELVELGVRVTMEKVFLEDELKLETCFFTVTGDAISGKWPCTLKDTNQQVIAKALLEKPVEELQSPETFHLKSGSTVEISCIGSPNSFYVRSVDAEIEQKFLDMNMEMIRSAPKAKHFPVPPSPGELCCAKFEEDNCFYRAVVKSEENGKVNVLFVDFGNEQLTDLRDVKPLPESLKEVPFLAVKVTLKKVSPKPWNNMIKEYISKLSSENIELTLTYEESLADGVVLREKVSGVTVNDFIEKARTKNVSSIRKKVFLDDDLKYTTPPAGVCVLAILYVDEQEFERSFTCWATVAELDNFNYVNAELSTMMSNHCESISTPYEPAYRELCLAEFEGSWYRAVCAEQDGDVYKVFFVDFGNACELKSDSIREMKEEFVAAPALAMNCILNGHERLEGKPEMTKKVYEMLLSRLNTCIKGVTIKSFQGDTFSITIPEIEAVLSG